MTGIPPDQLVVEVDHPNGYTWDLDPLDDAQYLPMLNGKPELRVPVSRSEERWLNADWEGAEPAMRAWQNGRRLPIDEFRTVEAETGRLVIVGEGGKQLDQPVDAEFRSTKVTDAVRSLIDSTTGYQRNVDGPSGGSEERLVQSLDTQSDLEEAAEPFDATTPLTWRNGGVETLTTCWTTEGEAFDRNGGSNYTGSTEPDLSAFSAGDGADLVESGAYYEWDLEIGYTIPADKLEIALRFATDTDSGGIAFTVELEYPSGHTESVDWRDVDGVQQDLGWSTTSSADGSWNPSQDLEPGTATLRIDADNSTSTALDAEATWFDVVAPFDTTFSYTFDNTVNEANGYLDGPETKPTGVPVEFEDASVAQNIIAGRVVADVTATDDGQGLGLSIDSGSSFKTGNNTAEFEAEFSEASGTIRAQSTLGRTGSRTGATPLQGYEPQRLEGFDLYATVEDVAVLQSRRLDGSLKDALTTIADYANAIWELRYDEAADTLRLEWTRPGQRTASSAEGLSDYTLSKDLRVYEKVTVRGSFQSRSGEQLTADHGTAVSLDNGHLVTSRESVRDPDSGREFERGPDYDLDYTAGELTTQSGGDITDGQTLIIDYHYEPRGSFASDSFSASDDRELPPQKINSVTSDREAEQAALVIKQDVDTPLIEATATLSRLDAGRSLIDDLQVDGLPTDVGLEVRELERTAEEIVLQLGSRRTLSEVINDLDRRLGATQERA